MLLQLNRFTRQRLSWGLLALSALFLESSALFFQHVMKLAPCEMCIYERIAVLGILIAGLIGMIKPSFFLTRYLAFLLWGYSAFRGLQLALEHVDLQLHPSIFSVCAFSIPFPSWLPLDKLAPWMFIPSGNCSEISWQLFNLSMPQWLLGFFGLYLFLCLIFAVIQLRNGQCASCCRCD